MLLGTRQPCRHIDSTQNRLGCILALFVLMLGLIIGGNPLIPLAAQSSTPQLLISEVHPNPKAVDDPVGEWVEIMNRGTEAVNLQLWSLTNTGQAEYLFPFELWVPAGGYVVVANHGDVAQNGGVQPAHIYHNLNLGNVDETLFLKNPDGEIVDSVAWGEANGFVIPEGSSLERTAPTMDAPWTLAHSRWPGSKGDWGSPGAPYTPPPTATPTPTPPPAIPPRLLISEIMANPNAVSDELGEWLELYNADTMPINLNGWVLADLDGEKSALVGDFWLAPGGYAIAARVNDATQNGGVAVQMSYTTLQLANEADELLLITPWGVQTDQLIWDQSTNAMHSGVSLERTTFDANASWIAATVPWPGSAGDLGSPGMPYSAPTPTPSPTAPPATLPRLFISEIMADPSAVSDEMGEWLELYNGDTVSFNLNGWILADKDNERITLTTDLWIAPSSYLVLARITDPAQNGGVAAQGSYTSLQLANEADELLLIAPWGVQVDEIVWGTEALRTTSGASLERASFDSTNSWVTAHSPWPGSVGDRGSPGAPYHPITPTPTATPTATPQPTRILPAGWSRRAQPSPLRIAQIAPQGSEQEYFILHNWTGAPVPLANWRIGDAEIPGNREGMYYLPSDVVLAPDATWIVARHATTFHALWGRAPDAEWSNSDPSLPQLVRDTFLSTGEFALADDGDELLLLDPEGALADAVAWKNGNYAPLALSGRLDLSSSDALYQVPNASYLEVNDLRHRFAILPADPLRRFVLPIAASQSPVYLAEGMVALWGSLGAASTFSPGGKLPPHILLAATGANGLDFIAIADSDRAPMDMVRSAYAQSSGPILLPAWRWQHPEGAQAVIYSEHSAILLGWGEFLQFLNEENALAQLPFDITQPTERVPLRSGDTIYAPGGLHGLQKSWGTLKSPSLPAGNTTPPLPGEASITPRYTGLAATSADATALLEALTQRRGWLTSSPHLWLTLRTTDNAWMGSTIAPTDELHIEVVYGDRQGAIAGIAIWQDDHLFQQLDIPSQDGTWHVTIPAAPGTMIYAVATQLDGDFAITAPLYVQPAEGGKIVINEVLPAPGQDHNGDGQTNSDDEYIELLNVGSAPVALTNYTLADAATATGGRRFIFGAGRFIGSGERMLLWRKDTGLSLNDDFDLLQLLDAEGNALDQIAWEKRDSGPSLSRVPDGGEWQMRTPPTPGQANQSYPPPEPVEPPEPDEPPIDRTDVRDPRSPTFGQATGPAGSVALAKLRGLNTIVEFRAQVVVPPGLYPSAIYVADAAVDEHGKPLPIAGIGLQVYLREGDFIPMQEGDWILVRGGVVKSFRGEMEIQIDEPGQAWPYETSTEAATPLLPLAINVSDIGESLEGRLVTFTGVITGWQGDSLYLGDPQNLDTPAIRVTVRSSLGWKRPYVQKGELYQITGVVSQFATAAPWNDGYRILVRYQQDILLLGSTADPASE